MYIITTAGMVGGIVSAAMGGWDAILQALFVLMATDYISGWIVAIVFNGSRKTKSGAFSSRIAAKGLSRKVALLLLVVAGHFIDNALGTRFLRDGIIFGMMAQELGSLMENVALTGVRIPKVMKRILDVLHEKGGEDKTD